MDTVQGFIQDLTGEKRGPSKHYRRFNVLTLDSNTINGWIFASTTIEESYSGNILISAAQNNTPVRLQGKITTEKGNTQLLRNLINNIEFYFTKIKRILFVYLTLILDSKSQDFIKLLIYS